MHFGNSEIVDIQLTPRPLELVELVSDEAAHNLSPEKRWKPSFICAHRAARASPKARQG
jgi:hypothetical protein